RLGDHRAELRAGEVGLDGLGVAGRQRVGEVLEAAAGQVVEHDHLVPLVHQTVDQRGADEPGTTGDEGAHAPSLSLWPGGRDVPGTASWAMSRVVQARPSYPRRRPVPDARR